MFGWGNQCRKWGNDSKYIRTPKNEFIMKKLGLFG